MTRRAPVPGSPATGQGVAVTDTLDPLRLGASLYTPATRTDLAALGNGTKAHGGVQDVSPHSLIYCLEDSVQAADLPLALERLAEALPQLQPGMGPLRFVRVRDPRTLEAVLGMTGWQNLHGFVLPKSTRRNLRDYLSLLPENVPIMPTLETREVFSARQMESLRDFLLDSGLSARVLALRVGGNDLLHLLALRRVPGQTVHEGPLAHTVQMLAGTFLPWGFALSSPVYEVFSDPATLRRELKQDLERGLTGKTIIHPCQIGVVSEGYQVEAHHLEQARAILEPDAGAVFALDGAMCEPATHRNWAERVLRRAQIYGVRSAENQT
ncbi:HpcH/HpaI aldolase/citrate lyase family protein [Deinococcus radiomollis]|uniref:HpcH/HpaI aldolase/citrate lyase family protein n=1 Tax=Deinococcus radiomollis TaxID=468916 RepID=UPI0038921973